MSGNSSSSSKKAPEGKPKRKCDVCGTPVRCDGWNRHLTTTQHKNNVTRVANGLEPIVRTLSENPPKPFTDKEWKKAADLAEKVQRGDFPLSKNTYYTIRVWGAMKALRLGIKWATFPNKPYAIAQVKSWFAESNQPPAKRQRTTPQPLIPPPPSPSSTTSWENATLSKVRICWENHIKELEAAEQMMTYIIYCYYLRWQGKHIPIYVGQTYRELDKRHKEHLDCGKKRNGTEFEKFLHYHHKDIELKELERNEECTKDWGSNNDRCFWADEREYWHICDKKTHMGLEHVNSSLSGFNKIKVAHADDISKYWNQKLKKAIDDAYSLQTVLKTEASI